VHEWIGHGGFSDGFEDSWNEHSTEIAVGVACHRQLGVRSCALRANDSVRSALSDIAA
jgi:hypothetical protein